MTALGTSPQIETARKRPVLTLVSSGPEADVLTYAVSMITTFIGFAGKSETAARACTLNFRDILELVEGGYSPARVTFYRMRALVEMLYGEEGLPESVRECAEKAGLMGLMHR